MNTKKLAGILGVVLLAACGSTATSTSTSSTTSSATGLAVVAVADFDTSANDSVSARHESHLSYLTASDCGGDTPPTDMDSNAFAAGVDCDEDGGIVAFATPTEYKVAVKRVALVRDDDTLFDIIADTGTLAASEVLDFDTVNATQNVVDIDAADLEAGTYTGIYVEIYYYQMTFPVAQVERNVRIYMSDDDFTDEGDLGHHQGDITFVDANDLELGWVSPDWLIDTLLPTRVGQGGAGGTDEQTGHERGFFGDTTLWNGEDFNQGIDQDIFFTTLFFHTPFTIADPAALTNLITVQINFLVGDAFYYEDFTPQGTGFYPDTGGEATGENAEWAPLAPTISVSVDTE